MPTTGDGTVIDATSRPRCAVAAPELHRGNAFQIAGVPADAGPRDADIVEQALNRLQIVEVTAAGRTCATRPSPTS